MSREGSIFVAKKNNYELAEHNNAGSSCGTYPYLGAHTALFCPQDPAERFPKQKNKIDMENVSKQQYQAPEVELVQLQSGPFMQVPASNPGYGDEIEI